MNIEQIVVGIKDSHGLDMSDEAAITLLRHALSKLAKQAEEPVARLLHRIDGNIDKTVARTYNECSENLYPDSWLEGEKLYTETQLLAAQQRTAEACAKVCNRRASETQEDEADKCADLIRNGHWRKYL